MSIVLLVMTDGRRECIEATIASAEANLLGRITRRVIHDDSGDGGYGDWLRLRFGESFEIVDWQRARRGFGGAIQAAWRHLLDSPGPEDFVFHLEDDFTFNRKVPLWQMAALLRAQPTLVQLALRRQPWNDAERLAGGIVEQYPLDYTDHHMWVPYEGSCGPDPFPAWWLEHRRFFTTNPSLYRLSLCRRGWPAGEHSEGRFSLEVFSDPDVRCGFWGSRDSGEWVTHIGHDRVGVGY